MELNLVLKVVLRVLTCVFVCGRVTNTITVRTNTSTAVLVPRYKYGQIRVQVRCGRVRTNKRSVFVPARLPIFTATAVFQSKTQLNLGKLIGIRTALLNLVYLATVLVPVRLYPDIIPIKFYL